MKTDPVKRLAAMVMALAILPALAIVDRDGNGMSDPWSAAHGFLTSGTPSPEHHPDADPDGDGWSNLMESIAGTDPWSGMPPEGFLQPRVIHQASLPGVFAISWPTRPGKQYRLLVSPDLSAASWTQVGEPMLCDGTPVEMAIESDPQAAHYLFWRVEVEDTDSDGDTLVDADEHFLGTDPFNPDSDGDGASDGYEMAMGGNPAANDQFKDQDRDDVADWDDTDPDDPLMSWQRSLEHRYAFFLVQGIHSGSLLGIDDSGRVYDARSYWQAGQVNAYAHPEISGAQAIRMNDQGNLLGLTADPPLDAMGLPTVPLTVYWWRQANETPLPLETGPYSGRPNGLMSNLTEAGRFIIDTDSQDVEESGSRIWSIDPLTSAMNVGALTNALHLHEPDYLWRTAQNGELAVRGFGAGEEVVPGGWANHLTLMPSGTPVFSGEAVRLRKDGQWQTPKHLTRAREVSRCGVALIPNQTTPFWLNGKFKSLGGMAPDFPSMLPSCDFSDISSKGQVVGIVNGNIVAGFPFHLEGVDTWQAPYVLDDPASGVDNTSLRADEGSGVQDKHWVMAPAGGSTSFRIHSGANDKAQIEQSIDSGAVIGPEVLTSEIANGGISAAAGESSRDTKVILKLGDTTSQSSPVGVKIMKARTVKVAVHPIALKEDGAAAIHPSVIPMRTGEERASATALITNYLNRVYKPQVNVTFDVDILPTEEIDFDDETAGVAPNKDPANGWINIWDEGASSPEMTAACVNSWVSTGQVDIDVWIVGGVSMKETSTQGFRIWGVKLRDLTNGILVDGSYFKHGLTNISADKHLLHTLAHEIGHLMVGDDHPNESPGGFAELKGTKHSQRLMCSAPAWDLKNLGRQLVKTEWDRMEVWLKDNPDQRQ